MKKRAKPGDIFTESLSNGKYMFGRVLIDIKTQCIKSQLVDKSASYLTAFEISYVVEAFDVISDTPELPDGAKTVFPGIVVSPDAFEDGVWEVIDNKVVDPKEVEFQEDIRYNSGIVSLRKGELYLETNLNIEDHNELDGVSFLGSYNLFDTVLTHIGKAEMAEISMPAIRYDKRFINKDLRKLIYDAFGEDDGMIYYEIALKHGFDTERFYK